MATYTEVKGRIESVANMLTKDAPKEWHGRIRNAVENVANHETVFMSHTEQELVEMMTPMITKAMIYDIEWCVGDTVIDENGKQYIVTYDNSDEPSDKRYGLFDIEKAYFIKRSSSVHRLQSHLKSFSMFPTALQIVDIEKKKA